MDKYLVVLGGNKLACMAIEQLEKNGYKVLVLDKNPVPDAYKVASKVLEIDFFKSDLVSEALKPFELAGIMAINDFGVVTAARIAKERNLFGYSEEAAKNVAEKSRMKDLWCKKNILTAKHRNFSPVEIAKGNVKWDVFPCIIKPSNVGGASRGVFYIDNDRELLEKLNELHALYPAQHVVVEEFIKGTEHTIEVLVYGGKTTLMSISDKRNYEGSHSIVQDLWFPGPKGNKYRKELEALLHDACMALDLTYGCAHFEVMITDTDKIYIIEVGGRPGGGLNFHPISLISTGYDYTLELASILTTGKPVLKKADSTKKLMWHFFYPIEGEIKEVKGIDIVRQLPNVIDADILAKPGQLTHLTYKSDMERLGHYLFSYEEIDANKKFTEETDKLVEFVLV